MSKIRIYAMTHKKFDVPDDPMYVPLQVGSAVHAPLGYLRDDTGDNISAENCYYSELTGMYWVWKNDRETDIVGICHYRRYLLNDVGYIFTEKELSHLLGEYDILTSKKLTLNFSYEYGFTENHTKADLDAADQAISALYPDFYPLYRRRIQENHTYFGNMMICKKELYDRYCQFLFPIFQKMHGLLDLDSYDEYHRRLYGFLSEFLLMVWVEQENLKVKECKVGMIGAKKETTEVTEKLLSFFQKKDIAGAKSYFLACHKKRPDILMEASDIDNHLHLCLEAVAIYERETLCGVTEHGIPIDVKPGELFAWINGLNQAVQSRSIPVDKYSSEAIAVARALYGTPES